MVVLTVTPDEAMNAAVEAMSGEFRRKGADCWRTASNAFQALFGVDPMGPHNYGTLAEAKAVIRNGGGRDAYCAMLAQRAGLIEAEQASGLIGIVKTDGQEFGWSGGLCIAPNVWAVKNGRGVSFLSDCIKCWGVPNGN